MAASTTWCTSDEVKELLGSARAYDATRLTTARNEASARINALLRHHRMTPATVAASSEADDIEWLNQLCRKGAAVWYVWSTTGSDAGMERLRAEWEAGLKLIEQRPTVLASYADASGHANSVQTHTTAMALDDIAAGRCDIPDPQLDGIGRFRRRL